MSYFRNFPLKRYSFGSGEAPVAFPSLDIYVDMVDQLKDQISTYRYYYIKDGDRPDQVSSLLYDGDTSYYWTFFLLNDHLRESGWPLTERALVEKVKQDHADYVITTQDEIADIFRIGQKVVGSSSGAEGTISHRNLDLGQIYLTGTTRAFSNNEVVTSQTADGVQSIELTGAVEEYLSISHYENADGKEIDINPFADAPASATAVTKLERYRKRNDDLKQIKVLTPNVASQVTLEFQKELSK